MNRYRLAAGLTWNQYQNAPEAWDPHTKGRTLILPSLTVDQVGRFLGVYPVTSFRWINISRVDDATRKRPS